MTIQAKILGAIAMSGLAALAMTSQANALTAQECSAKYQAAKTAGTLGGQKWNDFRKAQCGADAAAAAPAAAPAAEPKEAAKKGSKKDAAKEAAAPAAPSGPAVYPNAVDPKYSKETAGKATGNERLRRQGKADQMKAKIKQAGEKIKDALKK